MRKRLLLWNVAVIGWLFSSSGAQAPKFDTILYGAAYYHEYMPYDRLEEDVRLMQDMGISVVRVGESTWTSWEPREGEFEFAWMERILDRMHKAGIHAILGTPTYSIPPWMYRKHPEVMVTPLGQVRGAWQFYGPRQNMDITHPTYLFYCERIIRKIVEHFKDHPAVIGYQIDNETGAYGTAGPNVQVGFVQALKRKFGTVDALNKAWGLVYWGQLLAGWEEVPPRDGILNPGWKLEWERYQQSLILDFLAWQARLVNGMKRSDQFVTQDFHGSVRTALDGAAISKILDVAAINPYHGTQEDADGWWIALSGDFTRSLKRAPFLVTETNAQTTGWDSKWQMPPYDGQLRLHAYSNVAAGANMVGYWHWHSLHYGQETYWKGLLGHDLEPNRVTREASRIAQELKTIGPRLVNANHPNKAAILHSTDSFHAIQFMPFSNAVNYLTVEDQMHKAMYNLNLGVDFVFPNTANLSDYAVLLVPPLYVADDALLLRLSDYVKNGGHLVLSFKSGFCDEFSTVRAVRMPGVLRKAAGFSYQEFSNLKDPLPLKGDPFKAGDQNRVSVWAEMIIPETADVLARYDHPFFGGYPAITRNAFGKGSLTYEGTFLSDALQEKVLLDVMRLAGLAGPDQDLPRPVRMRHAVGNSGRVQRFYLNYSGENRTFLYPHRSGTDLLNGNLVGKGQSVTLGPWDLAIVEEK